MARAMVELDRPNLCDLFLMHTEAKGKLSAIEEADSVFSIHEGMTPFETDSLLSGFLA